MLDTASSKPLYREGLDYTEYWRDETKFIEMFPDAPPDTKACRQIGWSNAGEAWSVVYNPITGNVYCFYINDSDLN